MEWCSYINMFINDMNDEDVMFCPYEKACKDCEYKEIVKQKDL